MDLALLRKLLRVERNNSKLKPPPLNVPPLKPKPAPKLSAALKQKLLTLVLQLVALMFVRVCRAVLVAVLSSLLLAVGSWVGSTNERPFGKEIP